MSNMLIFKPLSLSAVTPSSGTGGSNLLTPDPKEAWSGTGPATVNFDIDLGSTQEVDSIMLGFIGGATTGTATLSGGSAGYAEFTSSETLVMAGSDLVSPARRHAFLKMTVAPITVGANTTFFTHSGGVYRIHKNAGTASTWDADARSALLTGDFLLRAHRVSGTANPMVGMNSDPTTDSGFSSIDYAAQLKADGNVDFWESGTFVATASLSGQYLWIRRVGTTLTFERGATSTSATVLRTKTGVSAALGFDSSFFEIGDTVDVLLTTNSAAFNGRYIRIAFAPGTSSAITVGVIAVGKAFQPTYNREWGSGRGIIDTGSKEPLLGGGFGIGAGARKAAYRWTLGDLTDAETEQLYGIGLDRGETRPAVVVEDPDITAGLNERIHYGLFDRFEAYERLSPGRTRWGLSMTEWV